MNDLTEAGDTANRPNMIGYSLREFVEILEQEGELDVREGVALRDVAAILEGNEKAVLFRDLQGGGDLIGNVLASRKRIGLAYGVEPSAVKELAASRLSGEGQLVEIPSSQAPVQELVRTGGDIDLLELPLHLQHRLDGGPFISAGMDFTAHPESGRRNVGIRRFMWLSRDKLAICMYGDLRMNYDTAIARGETLPITVIVGAHPLDYISASMRTTGDELAALARLRGSDMPVVKSITNDLLIPAEAEWAIEGYLGSELAPEGPFGEWIGYYGEMTTTMPIMHVTAVTSRRRPLFQTITIGSQTRELTDMSQLTTSYVEIGLWKALKAAVTEPLDIYVPPSGGGPNVRIKMRSHRPGEARTAIMTAMANQGPMFKNIYVVDPDIDIFSDGDMEWAMASRFQPARDLVVVKDIWGIPGPLDPSVPPGEMLASKAGYDLTFGMGTGPALAGLPEAPNYMFPRFDSLVAALSDGPKTFEQLMAAVDSPDGRDVILELDALRAQGRLARQPNNGRYYLAEGAP